MKTEAHEEALNRVIEENKRLKQLLGDLLARIHRDGGHYVSEHGWDKAYEDADAKVAELNARQSL